MASGNSIPVTRSQNRDRPRGLFLFIFSGIIIEKEVKIVLFFIVEI